MSVQIIGLENIRRQLAAMQQPLREITVTLPSEHGFTEYTCPIERCRATFKVDLDTWSAGELMHCVRCGTRQPRAAFLSDAQRAYAVGVALDSALQQWRLQPSSIPTEYTHEESDQTIACDGCGTGYAVQGAFGMCPGCARHNVWHWAEKELHRLSTGTALTIPTIKSGYCEAVNTLKTAGVLFFEALHRKHGTAHAISLQNFDYAAAYMRQHLGLDIEAVCSELNRHHLRRGIALRHIIEYKNGVIDHAFVSRTGILSNRIGRQYRFTPEEFLLFIKSVRLVLTACERHLEQ